MTQWSPSDTFTLTINNSAVVCEIKILNTKFALQGTLSGVVISYDLTVFDVLVLICCLTLCLSDCL